MDDQFYPGFAGKDLHYIWVGDTVRVREGSNTGQEGTVEDVRGDAFAKAYRIYVRFGEADLVWYWPWNLDIVRRKNSRKD